MKKNVSLSVLAAGLLLYGCGGQVNRTAVLHYSYAPLVGDVAGTGAPKLDTDLVNAWGIATSPSGPFWVSDNGTGKTTLYDSTGTKQGLVVSLPHAAGSSVAPVTGQVYNGTGDFKLGGASPALFLFSNEDGIISGWNSGTTGTTVVDNSATGAVYKGLAIASTGGNNFIYACNFNSGKIEMYDKNFTFATQFTDTSLPAGYAPFNIIASGQYLYVAYALQDGAKHDEVPGTGNGYVDLFFTDGTLFRQLVKHGDLNAPWGMALAPSSDGNIPGDLIVGNFGDGKINVYDPINGDHVGTFTDATGTPLVIDGLWGLIYGNGGSGGSTGTLYYTAGPNSEAHGVLGSFTKLP